MTALPEACAGAARWLPAAAALIAEPDADGAPGAGGAGSRPPWNQAAAAAYYDAHEGLRRLEASLRRAVTGRPGQRRGGSAAGTLAALDAIEALGEAVTTAACLQAAGIIRRWTTAIRQLPAIDEAERWTRLRADANGDRPCCPYCKTPFLRIAIKAGLIACVLPGCTDADGRRPVASMQVGAVSGEPMLIWQDGTCQISP